MDHYANPRKQQQVQNVATFVREIEGHYPWLGLFPASPMAPWHVQAIVKSTSGNGVLINFWPCAMRAPRDGCKSVSGVSAIRALIAEVIDETDDLSLIEDGEGAA